MGWEEFNEEKRDYIWEQNNPLDRLKGHYDSLSTPGLAYVDFASDALGSLIPGFDKVDERWDEASKFDNPVRQQVREILSVVLPAIHSGKFLAAKLSGLPRSMPWAQKH